MDAIDWPNLTDTQLAVLARRGKTPGIIAAAQAEQQRRWEQAEGEHEFRRADANPNQEARS